MKQMKKLLFVAVALMLGISFQSFKVFAADYQTKSYKVSVKVNEDQSYDITEAIRVNFTYPKHGLYRYIPYVGKKYSKVDGSEVTSRYKGAIKNVQVENFNFITKDESGNKIIQIGDENKTVSGNQTYQMSYKYALYDDGIKDYDEFYLNVIPTNWETSIEKSEITVKMPKEFDAKKVEVFSGQYGVSTDNAVKFSVKGNTIYVKTKDDLEQGTGITVRIMLPEGYFKDVPNDTGKYVLLGILGVICIAGLILLWIRFGKDRYYVKTVEFYPPEDMTPAELGYVIDGSIDKRDLVSLVMYHAQKGYLTIEEKKDGKKSKFVLHKEKDLPGNAKAFEKTFFNGLFSQGNGTTVCLDDLDESFYEDFTNAKNDLKIYFEDNTERNIFEKSATYVRYLALLILVLGYGLGGLIASFIQGDIMQMILFVIALIPFIGAVFFACESVDKRYVLSKGKFVLYVILTVLLAIVGIVLTIIMYEETLNRPLVGWLFAIMPVVGIWSACFMGRRTILGAQLLGKTLGFQDFLKKAEKNRLEKLVEENPEYFYDILPYAYVLGVSDKWAKKFETIAVKEPYWYHGYYGSDSFTTYLFLSHFGRCTSSLSNSIVPPVPTGDGGMGSFGGGGGFTGGGVGGGGGGSW